MMAAQQMQFNMSLSELLSGLISIPESLDRKLTDITLDSREVEPGMLFIAIHGRSVNGADYIEPAIAQGAVAVLRDNMGEDSNVIPVSWHSTESGRNVPVIAITALSKHLGMLADRFYGSPSAQLYIVGITGTNGKTSCSQFIAEAMNENEPSGIIGTLGRGLIGQQEDSGHTTPDLVGNHRWLAKMRDQGATSVAMEVSSHALDQGRVDDIHFDCAVFTNLSHEHLDYHGDMDSYAAAKRKLFVTPGLKTAIVNYDDIYGRQLVSSIDSSVKVISYGLQSDNQPMLLAEDVNMQPEGMSFTVNSPWGHGRLKSSLLGRFNISNLLAALGVLLDRGLALDEALARLAKVKTVNGRMETFGGDELPLVVVDYAHTPDALKHVLIALREHTQGKLWCVFGCGGDRDSHKRPLMGQIAEASADRVILTNDNPRHENPLDIIEQILSGMQSPDNAYIDQDRQHAIETVINTASPEDTVLVAGKGHEKYQQFGDEKRPFSDIAEVQLQLKRRQK